MRPYILCSLIALFLQNSAFSQKVSFETTVNLFSLDSRHLEQSQPMHPYVSDSGFVNFIGRSGDQNLLFTQNSKGDFQKDTIFKNEGIYNFIVDYLDLDNDGDKDIITDQNLFQVNGENWKSIFLQFFKQNTLVLQILMEIVWLTSLLKETSLPTMTPFIYTKIWVISNLNTLKLNRRHVDIKHVLLGILIIMVHLILHVPYHQVINLKIQFVFISMMERAILL